MSRGETPTLGVKLWIEPRKRKWSMNSARSSKALASWWLPTTTGMTVAQMQDLRAKMRDVGGSVRVAKNKLAKIALEGKPGASMGDLLKGMTVFAYSEDPVAAAKVTEAYAKKNDKFVILGGAMGDAVLDPAGVKAVASMPSREELIAQIVSCIGAPGVQPSPGPLVRLLRTSRASSRPSRSGSRLSNLIAFVGLIPRRWNPS